MQSADGVFMALYNFEFHTADSLCQQLESQYPDHYLRYFARSYYYWWMYVTHSEKSTFERQYLQSLDQAQQAMNVLLARQDYTYEDVFYFINIFSMRARLDVKKKDYVAAIRHMRHCIRFIELSLDREHLNQRFWLTSGMYHYMSDYGAKKYPFLRVYTLVYPRGSMQKGMEMLLRAANAADELLKTEATYFLLKIKLEIEQEFGTASNYGKKLHARFPANLVYLQLYYESLVEAGDLPNAQGVREQFLKISRAETQLSPQQLEYLRQNLLNYRAQYAK